MSPDRWQQVLEVFNEAVEQPPKQREALVEAACADDIELRREVNLLLETYDDDPDFLEEPAARVPDVPELPEQDTMKGQHVGPYKVLRRLGGGGMGAVYLAIRDDDQYRKYVALKVVKRGMDTEEILHRFRSERQILASLDHPNIARLLDGGMAADGRPYFAMEYVDEGVPLDVYCDQHRLTISERLRLFRTVCAAVHYAHQNLVVHRDLKPGNVLVSKTGHVKLLDFGVAKLLNPDLSAVTMALTRSEARLVTPAYASPEQVRGETVTTASDVYALGVLLYELLSGRRPYQVEGKTADGIKKIICEEHPSVPSEAIRRLEEVGRLNGNTAARPAEAISDDRHTSVERLRRQLQGDLDNIVLMAMRKDPHDRYASAEALSEDVLHSLEGRSVVAHEASPSYRFRKFVHRHRVGVGVALLLTASLLVGLGGTMWQAKVATEGWTQAQAEADKSERALAFLIDLLKLSDPTSEQGSAVTVRELLDAQAPLLERMLYEQPEEQAPLMDMVGGIYMNLGLYDEALSLIETSLDARRRTLGENHADVAQSLYSLAEVQRNMGRFQEAEDHGLQALVIQRQLLGSDHLDIARTLISLGRIVRIRGDFDTATTYFEEALAMYRRLLGEEHQQVAQAIFLLAFTLEGQSAYDRAEPLHREALAMRRKLLGEEHPDVAWSLMSLGRMHKNKGEFALAESYYREALLMRRKLLGAEHPDVAASYHQLARLADDQGAWETAAPLYLQSLDILRKALPEDHLRISFQLVPLGSIRMEHGNVREAEALLREGLRIRQQSMIAGHPMITAAQIDLGRCLLRLGQFEEAEALLLEGLQVYQTRHGPEDFRTEEVLSTLIALYEAWGKPEKVIFYQAQ